MRIVLAFSLAALLATAPAAAQADKAMSKDYSLSSSLVVAPTFESAELTPTSGPMSNTELLLSPGVVPAVTGESPTVPQPAPPSTVGWAAIGVGALVVTIGLVFLLTAASAGGFGS
jgi:hypothetical protein